MSVKPDQALEQLAWSLESQPDRSRVLWCADEHPIDESIWTILHSRKQELTIKFLTNRLDQYRLAKNEGFDCQYSDFDFSDEFCTGFDQVFVRIPKERALVHHIINQAYLLLPENGRLCLFGFKNEGIKTHIKRAKALFGGSFELSRGKNQLLYAVVPKTTSDTELLDDQNYSQLTEIKGAVSKLDGLNFASTFWSKPGAYGWNKVDQGSQFLTEVLSGSYDSFAEKTVLDLGCGYGYLSMFARHFNAKNVISTDNCAAALSSVDKNMQGAVSAVIASDAGDVVDQEVDLILCNPPFHQGFAMNNELHYKFLTNTRRLLRVKARHSIEKGLTRIQKPEAWFVVNQFLSLEAHCQSLGLNLEEISRNNGFKVLKITD